ncbi:hypothetical protein AQJ43_35740 [Streptomyces avermitilis]|uniref:hypothetical protein n=1 Tax=Streptomyces TaxID=1883 RepID=UPI000749AEA4|nr:MULTISPECIES: hypothetical protein [Streptomyces]KUN49675.1 hypothetical protein AQJ43_35740 [Streptomyces avermitilis]MYS95768.1 hypothetical protein [Streptomyces sp. SID5469]
MPDPDVAGLVHEQVLDGVPDGEGGGLAAERVEDLDLVRVLVPAGAGCCDDEPAVRQAVQVRPAGPHGAQLGEFDVAARMYGDDQRVEGQDIAAGLRSAVGKQPVGGAEDVDGAGQDVVGVVRSGKVGIGNEGSLLHGRALLGGRSRRSGAAVSGGGARAVESEAGRLEGMALSGGHEVIIVDVWPPCQTLSVQRSRHL